MAAPDGLRTGSKVRARVAGRVVVGTVIGTADAAKIHNRPGHVEIEYPSGPSSYHLGVAWVRAADVERV